MQVADYICANYGDDISIGKLADMFFVSPFYLMKIFKKHTGFSIINYLNRVRVKESAKMLERSRMSITDIATVVGFSNVTHFGRVFRQVMGDSPRNYRSAFLS
jgi:YesN/AraC family two-component response regulator